MEKILHEVLATDKSLLCRRDELIAALEAKIPANKRRDFAAVKKALTLNVGEKFFVGSSDKEATKAEVTKILKDGGLQEARINFVIETFTKALDWDKPLVPVQPDEIPEVPRATTQAPKINLAKPVQAEPEESSKPVEVEEPTAEVEFQEPAEQSSAVNIVKQEPPPRVEERPPQNNFQPSRPQDIYGTLPQNHKSKIFTTEGRLNRWAYFLQSLKLFGIAIIGAILAQFVIGVPILIASVVGGWMIGIRRLHDLNKSGWWLLICLIPYVNMIFSLYMLFALGTQGANRYGADPLTE